MGKVASLSNIAPSRVIIDRFLGADLTNDASDVSLYRSPDCPNIIRESAGKVRKWIGWHTLRQYDGQINGLHTYITDKGEKKLLVHAGTYLYDGEMIIRGEMADEKSTSVQLNGKLVIADGKKLLMYHLDRQEYKCEAVEDKAYVPTVTISRSPAGGGVTFQPVNMIGKQRKDSFVVTEAEKDEKVFQLSATEIDSVDRVEKLLENGGYEEITDYSVNVITGKVTFAAPPGKSPVTGQDNVIITYSKTVFGYQGRINSCKIMTLYGLNGARDRIFLAGIGNRDYYCQLDDATYWGDLWYGTVGQDSSKIMGYSLINEKLATHTDHSDNDTNIVLRTGSMDEEGNVSFPLAGSFQGRGAVSRHCFAVLETEPLYLTENGIMAITPSDVLGERYSQLRSYYLNGLLLKQNLKEAVCCVHDRMYMVAAGGYLFALDGTQADREENMPYSNRQYAGFYRTNVPARVIADIDGVLTFGTADGRLCQFYTDYTKLTNFCDEGDKPIAAKWTTPEILGNNFYSKKRFKLLAVRLGAAIATGARMYARYDGITEMLADYSPQARYFSFSGMVFSKFTFRTDKTGSTLKEKISVKPEGRKAQFILENDVPDEPLELHQLTIEFIENRG